MVRHYKRKAYFPIKVSCFLSSLTLISSWMKTVILFRKIESRTGVARKRNSLPLCPKQEIKVILFLFPNKSTALHHWDTSNKLEYFYIH